MVIRLVEVIMVLGFAESQMAIQQVQCLKETPRRNSKVTSSPATDKAEIMNSIRNPRICGVGLTLHCGFWLLLGTCVGQDTGNGGLEVANIEGTLQAAARDRIKLKTEDDQEYMAVLNQKSTLKYQGSADTSFLMQPGLYVRFSGAFDTQQGTLVAPLEALEVFKPHASRRMTREQRQAQTPGIYPVVKEEGRRAGRANPKQRVNPSGPQEFQVVGRIAGIEPGRMQILAGNRRLLVELAEELDISVAAGDTTFCRPGDKVSVSGLRNPQQENWLSAETIEIEGSEPLTLKAQAPGERPDKPDGDRAGNGQDVNGK